MVVPEAGCPIHDICKHQFIEGNLNCVLCGKTIITTTGCVGPGTTQPTAKLRVTHIVVNKWEDRLKLATTITNSFEGQCQMEMFSVGFVKQFISDLRKHDMEELIKMLPESEHSLSHIYCEEMREQGFQGCKVKVKQLIKEYYAK